ncbi:MAG: glycoside hydrolase family 3 [Frankiales bacterium]|nr:glycoside hydrolase family 3 [Frankiales bacterium]
MVGQLFTTYVYGSDAYTATAAQRRANKALYGVQTPAEVVRAWHLGGVILLDHNNLDPARASLSTGNVDSAAQLLRLTKGLQHTALGDSGVPLLISTDQEGGRVQRLHFLPSRAAERQSAGMTPAAMRCSYAQLGAQLRAVGVNQDLAPVADVTTSSSGIIGDRSFGPDAVADAQDVLAAVQGLQSAGVLATVKHWPGHGSTSTDSHLALAVIRETRQAWSASDRAAFAAALPQVGAVMVGHLAFPAIDPSGVPASLSPVLVNSLLRDQGGFHGLVVTDSLWMLPMRAAGSPGQVALRALAAGDDMLLMSPDLPSAYQTVLAAVHSSTAVRQRVGDAVRRLLAAKRRTTQTPTTCR